MSLCENIWTFLFKRICVCWKFFTNCIELRHSCWFTISDCFFLSKPRDMLTWIGNTCLGRFNKSTRDASALLVNFFRFEASVLVRNVFIVDLSLMRRENSFEFSRTLRERLWNSVLAPFVSHLIIFCLGTGSTFTSSKLKVLVSQLFGDKASEDSVRFEQQRVLVFFNSMTNSTQRSDGSSSRLICRFTSNSNDTSGTNKLGRGPLKAQVDFNFYFKLDPSNNI